MYDFQHFYIQTEQLNWKMGTCNEEKIECNSWTRSHFNMKIGKNTFLSPKFAFASTCFSLSVNRAEW